MVSAGHALPRLFYRSDIIMATSLINALALYINAKHGDECVAKSGMSSCHFPSSSDQGFLLESAFTVPDLALFAPRGDAMNFRGKVPDGGSPSFGNAMQAGLHPGDVDTERLSERDSGGL